VEIVAASGSSQFQQPHLVLASFQNICGEELPGLTARLLEASCVRRIDPERGVDQSDRP
jgi:hypothetical protein